MTNMMPEDLLTGGSGGGLTLYPGQWSAAPDTGLVTLKEAALATLINTDPIDKWYQLDPEPIARGQFAVVYHCRHRVTGDEFAAKFSSRWRLGTDCTIDILHEVAVCAMLRPTQRTVQLRDVFSSENEMVLVMEFAPGGDLQTLLDQDLVPYERDVISFTRQLLEGLVFIHDLNLVHLDIKPQNLVLMGEFPDCAVKLCDFEISRILTPGREVREILGTPDYVAPEIIQYEPITTKTDMWSLGVLTYVLLTGFLPFGGDTDQETFFEITLGELDFPEELFEDISAGAIDFIKRLLVRKPQSRMSARECLDHPWMKADLSKIKVSPQAVRKPPTSLPLSIPTTTSDRHDFASTSGFCLSSVHSPPSLVSALSDIITSAGDMDLSARSCTSLCNTPVVLTPTSTTPAILTPNNTTPTILTPMSSSPRDIGLPPVHPFSGPRTSAVNSTYSSTNSLYRGGSRQSLDRARSLSKSREVLFERMQMSNQKKALSKSRERLQEGRLGFSRSREDLLALRSFSHSEEALSVFSWLNEDDSIYKSCNNVFLPMLPMLDEDRVSGRLYKSLASIDKIDEVGTEPNEASERQSIFDSRHSINDEYNHLITKYNTEVNSQRKSLAQGRIKEGRQRGCMGDGRPQGCNKGGRGINTSCSKHPQAESQSSPKIPKVTRAERMKRDPHRRRKGKKEKEKQRTEVQPRSTRQEVVHHEVIKSEKSVDKSATPSSRAPSPSKRRGSVSHIEQRIQERHEKQQERLERQERLEKQERQEKSERRGSLKHGATNTRRRDSGEDKHCCQEKSKNSKNHRNDQGGGKPRSVSPPKRTNINKSRSNSSDATPTSSLESVEEIPSSKRAPRRSNSHDATPTSSLESVKETSECKRVPRRSSSHEATPASSLESVKEATTFRRVPPKTSEPEYEASRRSVGDFPKASNKVFAQTEKRGDMDEAYVSLEEPVDDGIFSRSESMDSSNTVESDHTVRATDTSSDTLDSTFTTSGILETLEISSQPAMERPVQINLSEKHELEISKEKLNECEEAAAKVKSSPAESVTELSAINEEEEDERSVFARSVSTSSDIGSMMSENSEAEKDDSIGNKAQDGEHLAALNWKRRGRSMSMQPSDPLPFSHMHLCRSNSFNLGMPLKNFVASPWGDVDVCEGAISRALEMFKLKSTDLTSSGRNVLERRTSLSSQ